MNWDRLLTAVAAVCCLVAVGTTATAMDSAVTTEPEEAVEFDHLPLPTDAEESVGQLRRQVSTDAPGAGTGGGSGGASGDSSGDGGGGAAEKQASQAEAAEGGDPKSVAGSQSNQQRSQSRDEKESGGSSEAPESLLERLLDLLRSLLAYLPLALGLLALGGTAYLLHDRFAGRLGDDERRATEGGPTLGDPTPRNDVSKAWYEMVERVGLDERYDLTPDEHAERAAERGVDPEAAATLTRLFEEVRYGDAPVTDERRRRARERVQEIRAQARRLRTEGGGGSER